MPEKQPILTTFVDPDISFIEGGSLGVGGADAKYQEGIAGGYDHALQQGHKVVHTGDWHSSFLDPVSNERLPNVTYMASHKVMMMDRILRGIKEQTILSHSTYYKNYNPKLEFFALNDDALEELASGDERLLDDLKRIKAALGGVDAYEEAYPDHSYQEAYLKLAETLQEMAGEGVVDLKHALAAAKQMRGGPHNGFSFGQYVQMEVDGKIQTVGFIDADKKFHPVKFGGADGQTWDPSAKKPTYADVVAEGEGVDAFQGEELDVEAIKGAITNAADPSVRASIQENLNKQGAQLKNIAAWNPHGDRMSPDSQQCKAMDDVRDKHFGKTATSALYQIKRLTRDMDFFAGVEGQEFEVDKVPAGRKVKFTGGEEKTFEGSKGQTIQYREYSTRFISPLGRINITMKAFENGNLTFGIKNETSGKEEFFMAKGGGNREEYGAGLDPYSDPLYQLVYESVLKDADVTRETPRMTFGLAGNYCVKSTILSTEMVVQHADGVLSEMPGCGTRYIPGAPGQDVVAETAGLLDEKNVKSGDNCMNKAETPKEAVQNMESMLKSKELLGQTVSGGVKSTFLNAIKRQQSTGIGGPG